VGAVRRLFIFSRYCDVGRGIFGMTEKNRPPVSQRPE
jgi:hypothetical protein